MITRAWLAWKRVAQGIGTFRARGVLTSYFVVMLPFGISFRSPVNLGVGAIQLCR